MNQCQLELIADGRCIEIEEIEAAHATPAYLLQVAHTMGRRRGFIRGEAFVQVKVKSRASENGWLVVEKLQLED